MREIKFRAWDFRDKVMAYMANNGVFRKAFKSLSLDIWQDCQLGLLIKRHNENKTALMQYTGLKDKNGKEIYESDLLAFEALEWYREHNKEDYVFEVSQAESGEWVGAGICTEWPTYCEIVGNIYENPELLEGEQ